MEQVRSESNREVNRNNTSSQFRYSIAFLLFVMVCVCGWFSGYRSGYHAGDSIWNYAGIYTKTYDVHDLVKSTKNAQTGEVKADFEQVVAVVRSIREADQETPLEVAPFELNLSLVVRGSGMEHRRIASVLSDLRQHMN